MELSKEPTQAIRLTTDDKVMSSIDKVVSCRSESEFSLEIFELMTPWLQESSLVRCSWFYWEAVDRQSDPNLTSRTAQVLHIAWHFHLFDSMWSIMKEWSFFSESLQTNSYESSSTGR